MGTAIIYDGIRRVDLWLMTLSVAAISMGIGALPSSVYFGPSLGIVMYLWSVLWQASIAACLGYDLAQATKAS